MCPLTNSTLLSYFINCRWDCFWVVTVRSLWQGRQGGGVRFLHPYGVYLLFLPFGRPWLPLGGGERGGVLDQPAGLSGSE